jgi:hypothetical protein
MGGGSREADAAADAGHFAGRNLRRLDPHRLEAPGEVVEVGVLRHLEAHHVDPGAVGLAQDHAVAVEFVERMEEGAAVHRFADHVEADAIAVVDDRLAQIEHPELDETRSQYTRDSHANLLRPSARSSGNARRCG